MTNLLIIENNLNLRKIFTSILKKKVAGLHITESESFADACNILIEEQPDVVLTNIHIAGQNASSFVKHLTKAYPDIHIIMLSEYHLVEYHSFSENIRKGAVFFANELNMEQLLNRINIFIKLKSSEKSKEIKEGKEKKSWISKKCLLPVKVAIENRVSFTQYIHTYIHTYIPVELTPFGRTFFITC